MPIQDFGFTDNNSERSVPHVEEFDPDPFLTELGEQGLPWHELFDIDIEL